MIFFRDHFPIHQGKKEETSWTLEVQARQQAEVDCGKPCVSAGFSD
jgi:hypothetical protein